MHNHFFKLKFYFLVAEKVVHESLLPSRIEQLEVQNEDIESRLSSRIRQLEAQVGDIIHKLADAQKTVCVEGVATKESETKIDDQIYVDEEDFTNFPEFPDMDKDSRILR